MKAEIHPEYVESTITCACGATYQTRSTKRNLRIGICSNCHPFYTGKRTLVDTGGRVGRFERRYGSVDATPTSVKATQSNKDLQATNKSKLRKG